MVHGFGMVLVLFWYSLVWFWYGSGMALVLFWFCVVMMYVLVEDVQLYFVVSRIGRHKSVALVSGARRGG